MKSINVAFGVLIVALGCCIRSLEAQDSLSMAQPGYKNWNDPSPHMRHVVAVAPGVKLEVLDWGGKGEWLVFLAGLGGSAHSFDNFAPRFVDRFHVIAITRRGFGASSQPASGYDIETLVGDIVAVLDTLSIARASFVAHSFGGNEITSLAAQFPNRVRRLVYLDATYDYTSAPPQPTFDANLMTAADSASPGAVSAYYTSVGLPAPESEIRNTNIFAADGKMIRDITPDTIYGQILGGTVRPPYTRVTAPAIAICQMLESPELVNSPQWWALADTSTQRQVANWWPNTQVWVAQQQERFRNEMGNCEIVKLQWANHYVYFSHPQEVTTHIRRFLLSP